MESTARRRRRISRHAWLLAAAIAVVGLEAPAYAVQHVLLLFPYEDTLGTNAPLRSGLDGVLHGAEERVEAYSEFLDAARFPGPANEQHMVEFLRDKYSETPIDLVVTIGQPAYSFMGRHRAELFAEQPWVVAGIRESTLANGEVPPNAVAVLSHFDTAGRSVALALQPDARQAIFVSGASVLDRRRGRRRARAAARLRRPSEGHVPRGAGDAGLLERLARLPRDTIVVYQVISRDGNDEHFLSEDLVAPITAASSAPVYGVFETYMGDGIVGGRFESWEGIGADIGSAVLHMLAGEPQPPRSFTAPPTFAVDWRQLRRFELDEKRLPPGTAVLYRQPSAWDQYKSLVFAVAALVAVQALLIAVWLLRLREVRAERALKLAEADVVEQREQVMHSTRVAILGQLSGALAHALNQPLTAIMSNAQAAQRMRPAGSRWISPSFTRSWVTSWRTIPAPATSSRACARCCAAEALSSSRSTSAPWWMT